MEPRTPPKLNILFKNFEKGINQWKNESKKLLDRVDQTQYGGMKGFLNEYDEWYKGIRGFLSENFSIPNNETNRYLNIFDSDEYSPQLGQGGRSGNVPQDRDDQKKEINLKIQALEYVCKAVKTSDIARGKQNQESLKNLSVVNKKNLVLKKLYIINDGEYFPLKEIFIGNNFYVSDQDVLDFMNYLWSEGYIFSKKEDTKQKETHLCEARISYKGQEHVEENKLLDN